MQITVPISLKRLAAFSNGKSGGNPAGVLLLDSPLTAAEMLRIAAEVGYSETVFSYLEEGVWITWYFSPKLEIPFCGHATLALGSHLAKRYGDGAYSLQTQAGPVAVKAKEEAGLYRAMLQSPGTHTRSAEPELINAALSLFSYSESNLHPGLPPMRANGGAEHLIIGLNSREALGAMNYDLLAGQELFRRFGIITIILAFPSSNTEFEVRNAFAAGGLKEDPATGGGAAALAGYLRDLGWPHGCNIFIEQGDYMGIPCRLNATFSNAPGSSIQVSGTVREIEKNNYATD